MRRKVGDLTRKLDAMTAKYETLKEAASSGKESNFDQLKKRTDQIAKGMTYSIPRIPDYCANTPPQTKTQ
jgi:hypothetical protein